MTLIIPASAIEGVARDMLNVDDLEITLLQRGLGLTGTYRRAGVPLSVAITLVDQSYVEGEPIGRIIMRLENSDVELSGGLVRRLVSAIVIAVVRGLFGDAVLLSPLTTVDGVTVDDDIITCDLSGMDRIGRALAFEVAGYRLMDLFTVNDIVFEPGQVRVQVTGSAGAQRLSSLLGGVKNAATEKGENSKGAAPAAKWLLGKASDLIGRLAEHEDRKKD